MRQVFQQYVNVRPSAILPGIPARIVGSGVGDLDWVIIRENTEGEYAGQGGRSHQGTEWEVATELAIFTRKGVERVMRFAFEAASRRPKKRLTIVSKSNAQVSHTVAFFLSFFLGEITVGFAADSLAVRTPFVGRGGRHCVG